MHKEYILVAFSSLQENSISGISDCTGMEILIQINLNAVCAAALCGNCSSFLGFLRS